MARPSYYVPALPRFTVCALHHEAKRRGIPMTRLADGILTDALKATPGWDAAVEQQQRQTAGQGGAQAQPNRQDRHGDTCRR